LQSQIHQALDKNTLELGQFQPMLEDCKLNADIIQSIISVFKTQAESSRISLCSVNEIAADPYVKVDKTRVLQIMVNLV
jgi:signal transduction histidine kinase